jgi:co-chaperonin GroES (HSP10)
MKLLNNRVLVKPDEIVSQTSSGILLPTDKEKPTTGVVVIGNKEVKKGKRILFSKFGYDEVSKEDGTFYVISSPNILAIYE